MSPRVPLLLVLLAALGVSRASAQKQEQGMLDRINNPDLTLKFDPADKQFSAGGVINSKKASVKTFAYSKSANVREGFRTSAFSGGKSFATKDFAGNKDASIGKRPFAQNDRAFATRDAAGIRDARDANKTLAVRGYAHSGDQFYPHGKSQGTIDALMEEKNLSIDQVRELLNKNR